MDESITIIKKYIESTGWNDLSIISLLCRYIDNQKSPEAFEDFMRQAAEEEMKWMNQ